MESRTRPLCIELIALIAHNHKKQELITFVAKHQDTFARYKLIATGQTGKALEYATKLKIKGVAHGPEGGDVIIAALAAQEEIEAVFFFRDPLTAQPHEPDVAALLRVCDVHSVPLATNVGTANGVIKILEQKLLEQDEPVKQRSA